MRFPRSNTMSKRLSSSEFLQFDSSLDGSLGLGRASSYGAWLDYIKAHQNSLSLPIGHVITSVYLAVRESDDRIIGIYNVRHYLNDVLEMSGNGNIGYCVRPTQRSKGYATQILKMALEKCKELGMKMAHVSCYEHNSASQKVILKNGGVLYTKYNRDDGIFLEYKIEI